MRCRGAAPVLVAVAVLFAACGSVTQREIAPLGAASPPPGPAASLTPLQGGSGAFMGSATSTGLAAAGYVQHEYAASGLASSYRATTALAHDGRWSFVVDGHAHYRTRVLIRRPADPARFSGTVVVEWLNVSGGVDADPEYTSFRDEILRQGDIWVGVSAQLIGVVGGPVLVSVPVAAQFTGKGLVGIDPARYGSLRHPGDGFSFDIFTQVARALRRGGPAMGSRRPKLVLAVGESQSAIALTTYVNGVQPLSHEFDGYILHSRAGAPLPLVGPGQYADLAHAIGTTPVIVRTDGAPPVIELQAESDVTGVLDSAAARQPDSGRFRLWEVAGTAHADVHLLGSVSRSIDCGAPINDGPMHLVAAAALHDLDRWLRTGIPPPHAPRLKLLDGPPAQVARDADGIAIGGIRTPPISVPAVVLSGMHGPSTSLLCLLLGSTTPMAASRLDRLYGSRSSYLARYSANSTKTIRAGWVLADDRAALLGYARPAAIAP